MINKDRLMTHYLEMIKINSVSGNEQQLADYLSAKFSALGLTVHTRYYSKADGSDDSKSPSIYATLPGSAPGPSLLLIGHLDTVAPTKGWKTDPFEPNIDGDKVYGLGSMDMKGGIAAILETVQTLLESGESLRGDLTVAFVADEEVNSRGTYQLLQEGLKADMAIMAECRFKEMAVGFRGRYSIKVSVSGTAAHASHYPSVGENALIHAANLTLGIERLSTLVHPELGAGTWCVRHIEGGTPRTLSVPDHCTLFVDRYVVPGEDFESCKAQILDLAKELGLDGKVEVELYPRTTPYMEAFAVPADHLLVQTVLTKYRDIVGGDLPLAYDKSVCDSNFLVTLGGIPTVTFGPSGENMHGANEVGYLSQIQQATEIYLSVVREILG